MTAPWPAPIGREAAEALKLAEEIRQKLTSISQWAENEWGENNFEAKIVDGLTTQGGTSREAAWKVAHNLARLLEHIDHACLDGAAAAKVFGLHVQKFYVEPIEEARRRAENSPAAGGLKVN